MSITNWADIIQYLNSPYPYFLSKAILVVLKNIKATYDEFTWGRIISQYFWVIGWRKCHLTVLYDNWKCLFHMLKKKNCNNYLNINFISKHATDEPNRVCWIMWLSFVSSAQDSFLNSHWYNIRWWIWSAICKIIPSLIIIIYFLCQK